MIVLQTRAEARARVGTARLIPLVLADCTICTLSRCADLPPQVLNLIHSDKAILLFPGADAVPLDCILAQSFKVGHTANAQSRNAPNGSTTCDDPDQSISVLIVLDGSWEGACRLRCKCPILQKLRQASIPDNVIEATEPLFLARPPPSNIPGIFPHITQAHFQHLLGVIFFLDSALFFLMSTAFNDFGGKLNNTHM